MKKIETIELKAKNLALLQMIGLAMTFVGGAIYNNIVGSIKGTPLGLEGAILVFVGTIIIHEMMHGAGFWLAGAKPSFGIGFGYFYATANQRVPLKTMLVTAYLPFIVLSALFLALALAFPVYQQIFSFAFISNFVGSVGDLWAASRLWKYLRFKDVEILDQKSGMVVYSSDKKALSVVVKPSKKPKTA